MAPRAIPGHFPAPRSARRSLTGAQVAQVAQVAQARYVEQENFGLCLVCNPLRHLVPPTAYGRPCVTTTVRYSSCCPRLNTRPPPRSTIQR